MDENMRKRNETLAKTVIKGLKSRNMSGYYAADKEEAVKLALELIPEGSTISMGGCTSAHEVGLIKALELRMTNMQYEICPPGTSLFHFFNQQQKEMADLK